jgi:hypothetical protein
MFEKKFGYTSFLHFHVPHEVTTSQTLLPAGFAVCQNKRVQASRPAQLEYISKLVLKGYLKFVPRSCCCD